MGTTKPRRAPKSRERYTLDSLLSVFPGGHWVEDVPVSEILSDEKITSSPYIAPAEITSTRYITVIGGTKYDKYGLIAYLLTRPETNFVTGGGRGVEEFISDWSFFENDVKIEPDPEMFGKAARKVNVEQVLAFDHESPLLLVGSGERVKQAKQWLNRARWGREVVELP